MCFCIVFPTCLPLETFILDFDTPPHELIKSKLFSYGIGGKWIDAFQCFRQQRVVVNGIKLDWSSVVSGVPQGTVLDPLLFSLRINGIASDKNVLLMTVYAIVKSRIRMIQCNFR